MYGFSESPRRDKTISFLVFKLNISNNLFQYKNNSQRARNQGIILELRLIGSLIVTCS